MSIGTIILIILVLILLGGLGGIGGGPFYGTGYYGGGGLGVVVVILLILVLLEEFSAPLNWMDRRRSTVFGAAFAAPKAYLIHGNRAGRNNSRAASSSSDVETICSRRARPDPL